MSTTIENENIRKLNSVLERGILPATSLQGEAFTSYDLQSDDSIAVNQVTKVESISLSLLYFPSGSITIALERKDDNLYDNFKLSLEEKIKKTCEQRMQELKDECNQPLSDQKIQELLEKELSKKL